MTPLLATRKSCRCGAGFMDVYGEDTCPRCVKRERDERYARHLAELRASPRPFPPPMPPRSGKAEYPSSKKRPPRETRVLIRTGPDGEVFLEEVPR